MAVHERDWDTAFPSEDEPDEHDGWRPDHRIEPGQVVHLKAHAISTFNRSASLAVHLGRVIIQLYGALLVVLRFTTLWAESAHSYPRARHRPEQ
jgi:hypothetical protein